MFSKTPIYTPPGTCGKYRNASCRKWKTIPATNVRVLYAVYVKATVMIMTEADKTKTVSDCCVGTGIFLLHASNFSLRLYAQDISLDMCKMTTANAFIYIPWMAYPSEDLIDWKTQEDYSNALKAIEEWQRQTELKLHRVTWVKKTNSLGDWL